MSGRALLLIVLLATGCLLGACGKKGEPEPPDKGQSSFPHQYPNR